MKLPSKRKVRRLRRCRRKQGIRFVKSLIRQKSRYGDNEIYMNVNFMYCSSSNFEFACRFITFTDKRFSIIRNKCTWAAGSYLIWE